MLLADLGADVIRVDRRHGSEDRYTGPVTEAGEGGAFLSLNRNKRSLTLDSSQPAAAEIIRRLAKSADVVVANLPIRVLRKMGLDYDDLRISTPGSSSPAFPPSVPMALTPMARLRYHRAGHVRRHEPHRISGYARFAPSFRSKITARHCIRLLDDGGTVSSRQNGPGPGGGWIAARDRRYVHAGSAWRSDR